MAVHIIAGVERIINQVDTYNEYNNTLNMTADEIFTNSRADRAYYKELQKSVHKKIQEFIGGSNHSHLPAVNHIQGFTIKGGTELEKARKMEEFYTLESIKFSN